ncbi:MAG TPA: methylated-DNA--[protein]-cysteine S-methyltransferase [Bacillota bacterium]|nr:methylated-DNA--[protein]-cysteine S-methyltransferase [Bacillota bacterium]HQB81782.1 methylated-DNA--[protein]-cysteine S-methyltransferase [Bacillota bacterium]
MSKPMKKTAPINLRPFYVKDISWLKEVVKQFFPDRTNSEWRRIMSGKRKKGELLFFIEKGDQPLGGVSVTAPFNSPTWRIARIHTLGELPEDDKVEIVRQIIADDPLIYRIDLTHMKLSEADRLIYGRLTGIDWPSKRETYFAPQVAKWQIAFIPWEFGYLAVVTDSARKKIASIEFLREGGEGLSLRVRQAAYFSGYLSHDGKILTPEAPDLDDECEVLKLARRELRLYLSGGHEIRIPYKFPEGTAFQKRVWEETLKIPYGSVKTYADIAEIIQPDKDKTGQMARAVGRALAANPLPIIIPCHRVIGSNQMLIGFGGGVDVKDYLLQLEMWHAIPTA